MNAMKRGRKGCELIFLINYNCFREMFISGGATIYDNRNSAFFSVFILHKYTLITSDYYTGRATVCMFTKNRGILNGITGNFVIFTSNTNLTRTSSKTSY